MDLTGGFVLVADLYQAIVTVAPLRTLNFQTIPLEGLQRPVAVDYDPVSQMVYWTDVGSKSISRCYLNGTGQTSIIHLNATSGTYRDLSKSELTRIKGYFIPDQKLACLVLFLQHLLKINNISILY